MAEPLIDDRGAEDDCIQESRDIATEHHRLKDEGQPCWTHWSFGDQELKHKKKATKSQKWWPNRTIRRDGGTCHSPLLHTYAIHSDRAQGRTHIRTHMRESRSKHFLQESNHTRGKADKHTGDLFITKERILFFFLSRLDGRKEALIS